jgi:hypothetical protein
LKADSLGCHFSFVLTETALIPSGIDHDSCPEGDHAERAVAGILMCPDRHALTVTAICRRYQISRKTFYPCQRRYRELRLDGMAPQSRRPHMSRSKIAPDIEDLITAIQPQ